MRLAADAPHQFSGIELDRSKPLSFRLDGRSVEGFVGDTVLSAVLASGVDTYGTFQGTPIGLAHVREFARPLDGSTGLYLDDLFVLPDARGEGAGTALLEKLRDLAQERGLSVVRWITAKDNQTARRLYDRVAEKTKWVTYDLVP